MDCSLPGSYVHGILQARILEWVVIFLLQGIFPTQGLNLCLLSLLHWQVDSLPLAPPGKPYLNALGRPGDPGLISESGRSPGEVNGNLLQYSCLKNPVDRGAWLATVQGVTRVGHDLVTKHHPPLQKYLIAGTTEMALQGTEIPLYR